jgi:cytoskeletal protein RodZ
MPASRTVFEFTGSEADREHRGSRGTFMGATLDLSHAKEERSSNLRSGPSTWIFVMVAILLTGGITAYMVLGAKPQAPTEAEEEPAAVAAAEKASPTPAADDAKAAGSGDETAGGSGDETAGGSAEPTAEGKADDAKAVPPAEVPKVEPAAKVDPPVEPTKTEPAKAKPKSTGSKPKPKTEPKTEPKPGSKPTLKPKKPPRDPLGNLPPPP